jgi:hypothetical protein
MAEFNIRADQVDVEQIMRQIRSRIREKRGVDYTEEQIQELAKIRLERFLDPKGVRSDLLEQFRRTAHVDVPPTYEFDDQSLFESDKPLIRFFRRLLRPVLKLFFNPNPLNRVLHMQTNVNRYLLDRAARDVMFYEVIHNLVLEMTRTGIEVRNTQMRVESVAGRLDFNERRARALEAVVQYKPEAPGGGGERGGPRPATTEGERGTHRAAAAGGGAAGEPGPASGLDPITGGESLRSKRRRRRRGRRSGPGFAGDPGQPRSASGEGAAPAEGAGPDRPVEADEQSREAGSVETPEPGERDGDDPSARAEAEGDNGRDRASDTDPNRS